MRTKKRLTLAGGKSWSDAPSESERKPKMRESMLLRTRYRMAVLEVEDDPHPHNLHGRCVVLSVFTDAGGRGGTLGFPFTDWPRLRRIIDSVVSGQ